MSPVIESILKGKRISILFQPIISLVSAKILGFECFSRGPSNSNLISFPSLFEEAKKSGLELDLECLCHRTALQTFAKLRLPGKLFLNLTPECIMHPLFNNLQLEDLIIECGLSRDDIVIELTEYHLNYQKEPILEALKYYHSRNFKIAMDDLGEGISSLRLWLDLRPEFVKIDKYFIQGIAEDDLRQEFIKSIASMAKKAGTSIIGEGIENQADMVFTKKLGIEYGQGYYIEKPKHVPGGFIPTDIADTLLTSEENFVDEEGVVVKPVKTEGTQLQQTVSGGELLKETLYITPQTTNEKAHGIFCTRPDLFSIPVVENGIPIGMVTRFSMIDKLARPYHRELYGEKPCTILMDKDPLVVDQNTTVQELSRQVVNAGRRFLIDGYIITDKGRYLGMGTGYDLMRVITELQINMARYANPLTLLPGNVPIHQEIDKLLKSRVDFVCVYCDLDHFKPFNDRYGFEKGDQAIILVGQILSSVVERNVDFLGHVGGDDFVVLFRSDNWEAKCKCVLEKFEQETRVFFAEEDIERGGYYTEDRKGNNTFHPLMMISLGAIIIGAGYFNSHKELSSVVAEAKKMAKKIPGNSLYVDRRRYREEKKVNSSLDSLKEHQP